jgi:hypothetical protein
MIFDNMFVFYKRTTQIQMLIKRRTQLLQKGFSQAVKKITMELFWSKVKESVTFMKLIGQYP